MSSDIEALRSLESQLEFEHLLAETIIEISSFFINLPPNQLDDGIYSALARVGEIGGADRVSVGLFSHNDTVIDTKYRWCASGIDPDEHRLRNTPLKDVPWIGEKLLAGEVLCYRKPEDFPKEAREELPQIDALGIQATIVVPLKSREGIHGAISMDSITEPKLWHARCVRLLGLFGEMLTSALVYQRDQDKLLNVQKLEILGQLASGLAHDFNNSIHPILGYTELLLETTPQSDPNRSALERIEVAGKHAQGIAGRLLTFGHETSEPSETVNVTDRLPEIFELLDASAPSDVAVVLERPEESLFVKADPGELYQVVMNLGINAIQAMKAGGGTLTISAKLIAENGDAQVEISVRDTGPGIPFDLQDKIFEPFFTTKPTGEGTGLGLPMVKNLVTHMEGELVFVSKEGAGTEFTITLPAITAAPEIDTEKALTVKPEALGEILIVDDEVSILQVEQALLSHFGYKVQAYHHAAEGLEAFTKDPTSYSLLVVDLSMPEMSGLDFIHNIREINTEVPVILTTGHKIVIPEDQLRALNVSTILTKPFSVENFRDTVTKLLAS